MARQRKSEQREIEQYKHENKERANNPPVGLVNPDTDPEESAKKYAYDPHIDPQLDWAGKAEHTSFEVPTVSLHVHERIDPRTIIEAVRKRKDEKVKQLSLFQTPEENLPIRQAIEFYKHKHNWTNRLIAGDSLLVMNSLLEKEGMAGQVQMIYIDPPYGSQYNSNFQPFVNKRDVKDGNDEDLTQEPETIKAFRDTWEFNIHSYLTYLRDRLLLAKDLLLEEGSIFVQIGDTNVHRVRCLMDEVFGSDNFCMEIVLMKASNQSSKLLPGVNDFLLWYAKDISKVKYKELFTESEAIENPNERYICVETENGELIDLSLAQKTGKQELPKGRICRLWPTFSQRRGSDNSFKYTFNNVEYEPPARYGWQTNITGLNRLAAAGRLHPIGKSLRWKVYHDEFPYKTLNSTWLDLRPGGFGEQRIYVLQTDYRAIERCLLMTTDPGDLVLDPTCGSGTTAYVAERWGRRWITCDTSRVSITLAKQRLMTGIFDYYELADIKEGSGEDFKYKTVSRITLKSIANNPEIKEEMARKEIEEVIQKHAAKVTLYDQPLVDKSKVRITGLFTVESVPAPTVKPLDDIEGLADTPIADQSIARSGETIRQAEWRDELLKTGIRGKNGQYIFFSTVEPFSGKRWLHADAETKPIYQEDNTSQSISSSEEKPMRAVISFGPEFAPLDQRQVEMALQEAETLRPKPKLVIFAAFQFDPEAAKEIDETDWSGVTLLKVQMNADLLTQDLKKKRASNESFWLIGQPDVALRRIHRGEDTGKWEVEIHGFDYYNTRTGNIESGNVEKIAMWMLDTDYDGRSVFPSQVFFPMAGEKDGWSRLARNLKAEIDEDLIESYRGTISLPFEIGTYQRVAVKIVDDRGIESLKIIRFTNSN
ncbi:site-specific DNA-methyltransferase [Nostoc sp. MS1]|uniref:site-specific DNA-methyltransferase n=1 Tax=Nostoc sp. MS1 TaxID=2764711 RepID=UPI001CC6FC9D|nr:site-specific DNA-methyltransferase [Nostoc sp. MS1]BCL34172.1 DNA methylase [Nostoc sp. MS1]